MVLQIVMPTRPPNARTTIFCNIACQHQNAGSIVDFADLAIVPAHSARGKAHITGPQLSTPRPDPHSAWRNCQGIIVRTAPHRI
jgi:hypothetical protein